ncbi:MAG: fructosamine kinase family protein [Nocardioides sp.]
MTRNNTVAGRAEALLGVSVVATSPVAGGEQSTCTRLRLADGTTALVKTHPDPPAGFFAAEARGLTWLRSAVGDLPGIEVPELLAHDSDCLIERWVEPTRPSVDVATAFGRALAAVHVVDPDQDTASDFGTGDFGTGGFGAGEDGFIGPLPMSNTPADTWPEFFLTRRVQPYLKVVADQETVSAEEARLIERAATRAADLVPAEPPARLHGDLWNGNALWSVDGAVALIDPAAYAGHREMDLAMLTLFGLPHLPRVLGAYHEAAPLADDWEDRLAIHQLFPLLAHACRFGRGYAARAVEIARRFAAPG